MNEKYLHTETEKKQQQRWAANRTFETDPDPNRAKFYCLEMLPYPSGSIHMGHIRNYAIGDALSTFKRMNGFNVLHPMGWDAFGMPAENAAIKNNARPDKWTLDNIAAMRSKLQQMGFGYDWRREIASCLPEYYKWNQWFLLQMWKRGLLYRKNALVNWCPKCNTSLANEQAEGGFCWRHEDTPVEQRELEQWFIRVTDYANELLDDLDTLENGWPERVLTMQRNWIGRSRGAEVDFAIDGKPSKKVRVFTTRIDTIFGANAVIVSPEHELMDELLGSKTASPDLVEFVQKQRSVSRDERIAEGTEKLGMATGLYAINPFSGEKLPVWTANFVLTGYGTGAIQSVPAHDERDFEFSKKYGLPIVRVIKLAGSQEADDAPVEAAFTAKDATGVLINSGQFNGLAVPDAIDTMTRHAEQEGFGESRTNFKIRDWGVSRQRAWGTPIPFVHCPSDGIVPVPENQLPVELPEDLNFNTLGSPLAEDLRFVNTTCPECGGPAKRDTDTMDTFVDSSWYYFRYCDPHNDELPFDPKVAAHWTPVDQYIGGIEHAVLHLIYTRVWTKIMRDLGLVSFGEPVKRLLTQGMVCLATYRCPVHDYVNPTEVVDGKCIHCGNQVEVGRIEKMSKSKKNTIDPDEMIALYGTDTVRLFMLFAAPPEKDLEWSESGAEGAYRFLNRVWRIVYKWHDKLGGASEPADGYSTAARSLRRKTHQTIARVTHDIGDRLTFNTAIAAMMELTNEVYAYDGAIEGEPSPADRFVIAEALETLVKLMGPFTPHIAEELWESLGHNEVLISSQWPKSDPELAKADELEIPVQLNGKLIARVIVPADISEDTLIATVLENDRVQARLDGRTVAKTIVVPRRLVNLVAR